jgi:hypothetical protein
MQDEEIGVLDPSGRREFRRDLPLNLDWSTQEGLIANLGLPAARNEKFEKARNGVLTLLTLSSFLSKAQPIPSPFMTPFAPTTGNDGRGRHPLAVKPGRTCG